MLIDNLMKYKKIRDVKKRINIMIEPDMNKQLTEFSQNQGLSKSEIIWLALVNFFIEYKKEKEEEEKEKNK